MKLSKSITLASGIFCLLAATTVNAQPLSSEDEYSIVFSKNEDRSRNYCFIPLTFGAEYAGFYLIHLKKQDTSHYYLNFFWAVTKAQRSWSSFKFRKSDFLEFEQKHGPTLILAHPDTTYNTIFSTYYAVKEHTSSYRLFHAVFELDQAFIENVLMTRMKRVSAKASTGKPIGAKIKGKRFARLLDEFLTAYQ